VAFHSVAGRDASCAAAGVPAGVSAMKRIPTATVVLCTT
jgi:hypothetical protein